MLDMHAAANLLPLSVRGGDPMTFLLIVGAWLAVSVPLSVATGRLLARRSAELEEVGR